MKKWLRIIAAVLTAIYALIYIITTINKVNTGRFDTLDYAYMAAFIIFLGAFICCYDYPVITGILFIIWSGSIWIIYRFENFDILALFMDVFKVAITLLISVLGILFIVNWRDCKSQF